jgi:hypothetical protein
MVEYRFVEGRMNMVVLVGRLMGLHQIHLM